MKEARYYKKLKDDSVQCALCPHNCVIKDKERGKCQVRENREGKLYTLVYGKACSVGIDPVEKKPLYHFYPGSKAFSIGTTGCNLSCKFCQNWTTAQQVPEKIKCPEMSPEEIVNLAIDKGCKIISYTYNEPTIFLEFALDIAKIAKEKGLKNVTVTNGFINQEPLKDFYKYTDAANVDLKAFDENFYKDISEARLEPVLEALKTMKRLGVWLEITNLVIPVLNDSDDSIKKLCEWVKTSLGEGTPIHFSRFHPDYKMTCNAPTPEKTLEKARSIAKDVGLKYSYIGNIITDNNTYCPKCGEVVIERPYTSPSKTNIKDGKCKCGEKIDGVFV